MLNNLLVDITSIFKNLWESSGLSSIGWQNGVMLLISFVLMYLAIVKKFEPLLLLPIAFGMFLINIPGAKEVVWGTASESGAYNEVTNRGLLWYLFYGVENVIYPPLIFLGIGAMTDFGPLISNPKSMLIGAAAQLGIFLTLIGAIAIGFNLAAACSIAIIGGADGPTAIYVTQKLSHLAQFNGQPKELLSAIAVAAYSYMALIPIIQKPLMKLIVPKKERQIKMEQLREVSKTEKILFPIICTLVVCLIIPDCTPLIGCLMFGNLIKESGVVPNLVSTASNALLYIVTIFLNLSIYFATHIMPSGDFSSEIRSKRSSSSKTGVCTARSAASP